MRPDKLYFWQLRLGDAFWLASDGYGPLRKISKTQADYVGFIGLPPTHVRPDRLVLKEKPQPSKQKELF